MKKIYLLTLATLFAGAVSAQRSLDLSLTLTDPVEASTVPQTTNQNLDFEVSNLGDDLIENDTIVLYLYNATTQEQYSMAGQLRSEEHTSELQSRPHLVCRLLLEKKKPTGPM